MGQGSLLLCAHRVASSGDACVQGEPRPPTGPCLTQMLPFASSFKFGRKIFYVNYLSELSEHVKLEQLGIPRQVLK